MVATVGKQTDREIDGVLSSLLLTPARTSSHGATHIQDESTLVS